MQHILSEKAIIYWKSPAFFPSNNTQKIMCSMSTISVENFVESIIQTNALSNNKWSFANQIELIEVLF